MCRDWEEQARTAFWKSEEVPLAAVLSILGPLRTDWLDEEGEEAYEVDGTYEWDYSVDKVSIQHAPLAVRRP